MLQTHTHTEHATLIAFPLQQWLHERASLLRHTHSTLPVSVSRYGLKTSRTRGGYDAQNCNLLVALCVCGAVSCCTVLYRHVHTCTTGGLCFLGTAATSLSDWCFSEVRWYFRASFETNRSLFQNTRHAVQHSNKQTANQLLMPRGVDGCTKLFVCCSTAMWQQLALCCTNCKFHFCLCLS